MPPSPQDASDLGASTVPPKRINANFPQDAVDKLRQCLVGSVVLPADPSYDASRQAYIKTYQRFPQIIVYCEIYRDVALALTFAQKYGLEVTCRSGGHNTAGYSVNSGLVIDLSRMNYVSVDPDKMRATVGVGASSRTNSRIFGRCGASESAGTSSRRLRRSRRCSGASLALRRQRCLAISA
jgi:hypothetical protein